MKAKFLRGLLLLWLCIFLPVVSLYRGYSSFKFATGMLRVLLYSSLHSQKPSPGRNHRGRSCECCGTEARLFCLFNELVSSPVCLSLSFSLSVTLLLSLSHTHTHAQTHFLSHLGPYAVWYGAVSPPGAHSPHDDAYGYSGSSRGSAATHAPDCPQPHTRFLHHTFLLPSTSTRYVDFIKIILV